MAHAELVDPADIPRFKELNVTPDMGIQWAKPSFDSIDAAKDYLGPTRFNRMEPEGYFVQAGVPIAQGSDWPVDPLSSWFDLQVLVTREGTLGGKYSGPLGTVPGVPVKEAIRAFTINGAYALHSDQYFGSLEQGKLGDLIVIDQNLLQIPPRRIAATKVLLTLVGGETVFRDASF
jgi:predicted amidohydrolase YtcJ